MELITAFLLIYLENFPIIFAACVAIKLFRLQKYSTGAIIFIIGAAISSILIDVTERAILSSVEPSRGFSDVMVFITIYSIAGIMGLLVVSKINSRTILFIFAVGIATVISLVEYMINELPLRLSILSWLSLAIGLTGLTIVLKEVSAKNNAMVLLLSLNANLIFSLPYFFIVAVLGGESV